MSPVTLDGRLAMPIEEAARTVGVSVATLRRMMRRGELATFTLRRRRLVPVGELVRLAGMDERGRYAAGRV